MSGFTGSAGWLVISRSKAYLAVDFRYIDQAKKETTNFDTCYVKGDITNWLPAIIKDSEIARLGVESDYLPVSVYQSICQTCTDANNDVKIVPVKNIVESLRIIKNKSELNLIKQACKIAGLPKPTGCI